MIEGLYKLIIKDFIYMGDERKPADVKKSREQLKNFFATYSKYTPRHTNKNSKIGGPWRSFISSIWEFENQSKVFYNTVFSGPGSYDLNGNIDIEKLSFSYFENQEDSPQIFHINRKIQEVGFVLNDEK